MFHHFLAARGYTVLDIALTGLGGGTAGTGGRPSTGTWGGKDLSDPHRRVRWLGGQTRGIDPQAHSGIYGRFVRRASSPRMAPSHGAGCLPAGGRSARSRLGPLQPMATDGPVLQPAAGRTQEGVTGAPRPSTLRRNFRGHSSWPHGMVDVERPLLRRGAIGAAPSSSWGRRLGDGGVSVEDTASWSPVPGTDEYRRHLRAVFQRVIGSEPGGVDGVGEGGGSSPGLCVRWTTGCPGYATLSKIAQRNSETR